MIMRCALDCTCTSDQGRNANQKGLFVKRGKMEFFIECEEENHLMQQQPLLPLLKLCRIYGLRSTCGKKGFEAEYSIPATVIVGRGSSNFV